MPLNKRLIGYITIFSVVAFLAFLGLQIYFTKYRGYCNRVAYSDNIGNLKLDNKLKVAGVEVGRVENLVRENGKAKIFLRMQSNVTIRTGYHFRNEDISLMGDRVLLLDPGLSGDTLPVDSPLYIEFVPGIAEGIRNADSLKTLILKLKAMVIDYSRVDPKNDSLFTTKLSRALSVLDRTSANLEKMLVEKEAVITRNIQLTEDYSGLMHKEMRSLTPKAADAIGKTERFSGQALALIDKMGPALDDLSALLEKTEKGENLAGKAIADTETYPKLIAAIKKIRSVISSLKQEGVGLDVDLF